MKLNFSEKKNSALTVFEVVVIVACLFILAAMLLPMLAAQKLHSTRTACVINLKQVNLAFRIWDGDQRDQYPMGVSVTNGGAMELIQTGRVSSVFQVMSNELSTTRILVCPNDPDRTFATNWNDLSGSHISYFVNADVTNEDNPQMVLDGDDNFLIGGEPVKSGLVEVPSNSSIAWSDKRHKYVGNLGFADGSVQEDSRSGMQHAFQLAGLATNQIAIP